MRLLSMLVTVVFLFAAPAESGAASLEEELAALLLDHPNIRAAAKTVESTRQEIRRAKSDYFPQISASSEVAQEVINSPAERQQGDGQGGKPSSRTAERASFTMAQNLFNGFLTSSLVRTARLNKSLAQSTLRGTNQNTVFEGVNAYINVLRQKRLIELARENVVTTQTQFELEDQQLQGGKGDAITVLEAESILQIAKDRLVTFEGALEDAISRYSKTFNHAPDINAMTDPVPPVEMVPSNLERAIDIAVVGNPQLGNSSITIEVARERKQAVRAELYPSLDLNSTWNFEKNAGGVLGVRRDYSVILSTTWNLFTGFSTRNLLSQASFNLGATKDTHDFTSRTVIEQTKLAWQALLTARKRLEVLEDAVNIASEVFAARQRQREAGKATIKDVLTAETAINNAQINFASASYDERIAVYQLLLAMGLLDPAGLKLY